MKEKQQKNRLKVTVCNFCNSHKKIKEFVGQKRELGTICSFCRSAMFKTIVQKSQKMKNKLFDNAESLNIIRFAIGNTGAFALGA